nr:terminase [uncultured bacterium]
MVELDQILVLGAVGKRCDQINTIGSSIARNLLDYAHAMRLGSVADPEGEAAFVLRQAEIKRERAIDNQWAQPADATQPDRQPGATTLDRRHDELHRGCAGEDRTTANVMIGHKRIRRIQHPFA